MLLYYSIKRICLRACHKYVPIALKLTKYLEVKIMYNSVIKGKIKKTATFCCDKIVNY